MLFQRCIALTLSSLLLLAPTGTLAAQRAGVSAAVQGEVSLSRPSSNVVGKEIRSGQSIFLEDSIKSGARSGMQVMLLDETVFTIGPNSEIVIDRFVYDPDTDTGEVGAQVVKGVFRFVTGKVAAKQPSAMEVKLPVGNIGIRGTMVGGIVRPDGSAVVFLLGAGPDNDLGADSGAFVVTNGGVSEWIRTPGWGVELFPGEPPRPVRIDPALIAEVTGAVNDPESYEDPSDEGDSSTSSATQAVVEDFNPSEESGESEAAGGASSVFVFELSDETEITEESIVDAIQNLPEAPPSTLAGVEDLTAITSGLASYAGSAVALSDGGAYDFDIGLDFDSQQVVARFFNIDSPTLGLLGVATVGTEAFTNGLNGQASFQLPGALLFGGGICAAGCLVTIAASFFDAASPPQSSDHELMLEDPSQTLMVMGGLAGVLRSSFVPSLDPFASLAELAAVPMGLASYVGAGALSDGGSFDVELQLDFDAQQVVANVFSIDSPALSLLDGASSGADDFSNGIAGDANFVFAGSPIQAPGACVAGDCTLALSASFFDAAEGAPETADFGLALAGPGVLVTLFGGATDVPLGFFQAEPFALVSELEAERGGIALYAGNGGLLSDGGTYEFEIALDFNSQELDAQFALNSPSLGLIGARTGGTQTFQDGQNGDASFAFAGGAIQTTQGACSGPGCGVTIGVDFFDAAQGPPTHADHRIDVEDQGQTLLVSGGVVGHTLTEFPVAPEMYATVSELDAVGVGLAKYAGSGLLTGGGGYDFQISLDFDARTVVASFFNVDASALSLVGGSSSGTASFDDGMGDADYRFAGSPIIDAGSACSGVGCGVGIAVAFPPSPQGEPAFVDHEIDIQDPTFATTVFGGDLGTPLAEFTQFAVLDDLATVPAGFAVYSGEGMLSDGGGFSFDLGLDFSAEQVFADLYDIESPVLGLLAAQSSGTVPFATGLDNRARFDFATPAIVQGATCTGAGCSVALRTAFSDTVAGVPQTAELHLDIADPTLSTLVSADEIGIPNAEFLLNFGTVAELGTLSLGIASYQGSDFLSDGGSFDFRVALDLDLQLIRADFLNISSPTLGLSAAFFAVSAAVGNGINGYAHYRFAAVPIGNLAAGPCMGAGCSAEVFTTFFDAGTGVPQTADVDLELQDPSQTLYVEGVAIGAEPAFDPSPPVASAVTDLQDLTSGFASFEGSSVLSDGGSYDYAISLDFNAQQLGAGFTNLNSPVLGLVGATTLGSQDFTDAVGGEARFQFIGADIPDGGGPCGAGGCDVDLDLAFFGASSENPPLTHDHSISIIDPTGALGVFGGVQGGPLTSFVDYSPIPFLPGMGNAYYTGVGSLSDGGSFGFDLTLDFDSQEADAFFSNIASPSLMLSGAATEGNESFTNSINGRAEFDIVGLPIFAGFSAPCETGCSVDIRAGFENGGVGTSPVAADFDLVIDNGVLTPVVASEFGIPLENYAPTEVPFDTVAQLGMIGYGIATYAGSTGLSDGGSYDYTVALDFAQQQVIADLQNIDSPALELIGYTSSGVAPVSSGQGGDAEYVFAGNPLFTDGGPCTDGGCNVDFEIGFFGANPGLFQPPQTHEHEVRITSQGGIEIFGGVEGGALSGFGPLLATIAELDAVGMGSGFYVGAAPLSDGGSFDFDLEVDFDSREVDAELTNIASPSLQLSGVATRGTTSFDNGVNGKAEFDIVGIPIHQGSSAPCEGGCAVDIHTRLNDPGVGTSPSIVDLDVAIEDAMQVTTVTGGAVDVPLDAYQPVPDQLATVLELQALGYGVASYFGSGSLSDGGSYDYVVALDFDFQEALANLGYIESPALGVSGEFSFGSTPLSNGVGGEAAYDIQGSDVFGAQCAPSCTVDVSLEFFDADPGMGLPPSTHDHHVLIQNAGGIEVFGDVVDGTLTDYPGQGPPQP